MISVLKNRKYLFPAVILFMVGLISIGTAQAQNALFPRGEETTPKPFGEVLQEPICFKLVNIAPYTVFGQVKTNYFIRGDGVKSRHRSNFNLKPKEEADICTSGPFFDGRRLQFQIKTLIPLFDCKTTLSEIIYVRGKVNEDGSTKTWIDCY